MTANQDPLVRIAHAIADFGHPFYAEERQRDVWNEASSFALALLSWTGLAAGVGMLWYGGATAIPYATVLLLIIAISNVAAVAYANRLGVEVLHPPSPRSFRLWAYVAIALLYAGLIGWTQREDMSYVLGFVLGIVTAVAAIALTGWWRRRRVSSRDRA